jgi:hypothetical protein
MTRPAAKRPRTVSHDTTETTESGELDNEDEINSVTEETVDEESIDGDKPFRMVSSKVQTKKHPHPEAISLTIVGYPIPPRSPTPPIATRWSTNNYHSNATTVDRIPPYRVAV